MGNEEEAENGISDDEDDNNLDNNHWEETSTLSNFYEYLFYKIYKDT